MYACMYVLCLLEYLNGQSDTRAKIWTPDITFFLTEKFKLIRKTIKMPAIEF